MRGQVRVKKGRKHELAVSLGCGEAGVSWPVCTVGFDEASGVSVCCMLIPGSRRSSPKEGAGASRGQQVRTPAGPHGGAEQSGRLGRTGLFR